MVDTLDGLLVIDKPSGMSSFDVIRRLRRATGQKKWGHAGTLDPMATGVLPILGGRGTRLVPYIMGGQKKYAARVLLGASTNTDDAEGTILEHRDWSHVTPAQVEAALQTFVGEIEQVPPQFSAIRVNGKRAYKSARKGEEVVLVARRVNIEQISVIEMALPEVLFEVQCGKGTYIRSIARDLGALLGCGGHLVSLRRTCVGPFDESVAIPLAELEEGGIDTARARMLSQYETVQELETLEVDVTTAERLSLGQHAALGQVDSGTYRVPTPGGSALLAIVESDGVKVRAKVFTPEWKPFGS